MKDTFVEQIVWNHFPARKPEKNLEFYLVSGPGFMESLVGFWDVSFEDFRDEDGEVIEDVDRWSQMPTGKPWGHDKPPSWEET